MSSGVAEDFSAIVACPKRSAISLQFFDQKSAMGIAV